MIVNPVSRFSEALLAMVALTLAAQAAGVPGTTPYSSTGRWGQQWIPER